MDLIVRCWTETPDTRPNSADLNKELAKLCSAFDGFSGPLLDRILRRLENYSTALERKVADKVYQVLEEQERCDELLKEMLPSPVVQQLRQGRVVVPEVVEEATVLFCDIEGFAEFVMVSTAEKVFRFLDAVYVLFDRVVTTRSVYKMETISSCYIVVSGLVLQLGTHHAEEVCRTALALHQTFRRTAPSTIWSFPRASTAVRLQLVSSAQNVHDIVCKWLFLVQTLLWLRFQEYYCMLIIVMQIRRHG
ncbi:atrial natriuretic peptide receptor 1-like [Paramacrobiotus metropolitanus]|uniref:atrial natriuretic peptide receptor 1-like n=1 Tax=Paramacrobiotus metropolitanus TaxID=2943436 RepID=UPI002445F2DE|nr:atrial natriuretic peptide receptor 1-like [Paramacrobiotus metropolitanus]